MYLFYTEIKKNYEILPMFIRNLSKQIAETMQLAVLVLLAVLLPLMHIASIHSITLCKGVHF